MAERATYFMITSNVLEIDVSIKIIETSIIKLTRVDRNAIVNASNFYLKFSGWLTRYFIMRRPFLISFSTLKCISIEATNLMMRISIDSGT